MKYSVIFVVLLGLLSSEPMTKFIHGQQKFLGPPAKLAPRVQKNVYRSFLSTVALALITLRISQELFRQRNAARTVRGNLTIVSSFIYLL
ncbi:hypothetical protein CHS0354_002843 [Potamilus streckersoni]|uniref:Uncharacterized protein n=1 Tax=Potamilus streckersoni TaxID=2493646 RepID=A0AAE0T1L1_9BIVA|nr:hypothetical protein CHS0354_002843 [Potamilus streckersoni]